jgi:fermentation-respiration switch protein FrsA (DUF1100 family)
MYSSSDFEKVWFLYKTEGEPKGISINAFCENQGVPYEQFNDRFYKTRKKVVPVVVEGAPHVEAEEEKTSDPAPSPKKKSKSHDDVDDAHGIRVMIQSRTGLRVCKSNLTYQGLEQNKKWN